MFGLTTVEPKPEDVAAFDSQLMTILIKYPTTAKVRTFVRGVMHGQNEAEYTTEEILKLKGQDLTPAEQTDVEDILSIIK